MDKVKKDLVTLEHPVLDDFTSDRDHCYRIMSMRNPGGWTFKKKSDLDAFNKRNDSGDSNGEANQQAPDSEGEKKSRKDSPS